MNHKSAGPCGHAPVFSPAFLFMAFFADPHIMSESGLKALKTEVRPADGLVRQGEFVMPEAGPRNSREAILLFHFADRLKSELLIASHLFALLQDQKGQEQEGAKRLFLHYFRALEGEMGMGLALIGEQDMVRLRTVLSGLTGMVDANMFGEVQTHLTWMISTMTTHAQRAMEFLRKEGLL